jgi:hypothetical protein
MTSKTVTPAEFDAAEFDLIQRRDKAWSSLGRLMDIAHRMAGDRQRGFGTGSWQLTDGAAEMKLAAMAQGADSLDLSMRKRPSEVIALIVETRNIIRELQQRIEDMEAVFRAAPWNRYFPCLNADGHIHASLRGCPTVRPGTSMGWATQMSGLTPDEAIHGVEGVFEGLGETLCSVCFPGAPAEWCRTRSEVTKAERAAAKAAKAEAKFVKNLRPDEIFRTHDGERIETVAAAKALVRKPAETEIELEWNRSEGAAIRSSYPERQVNMIASIEARLGAEGNDAGRANEILMIREAAAPGTGWTQADADKAVASAAKRAHKAWFG